jgi:hypothetical protein
MLSTVVTDQTQYLHTLAGHCRLVCPHLVCHAGRLQTWLVSLRAGNGAPFGEDEEANPVSMLYVVRASHTTHTLRHQVAGCCGQVV